MKTTLLLCSLVAALAATPVLACGGEPVGENLRATHGVKAALRTTYAAAHPGSETTWPLSGTYYGRYDGDLYAVAPFVRSGHVRTTIFLRHPRGGWRVVRETTGEICTDYVPAELIHAWWLVHTGGRCFRSPAGS